MGPGVCSTCRTSVVGAYPNCWQCNNATRRLPSTADVVAAISLSVKGEQFAYELSNYKNSPTMQARERMTLGLAAVVWRWLASHEHCVADAGTDRFDIVTVVPTTRAQRGTHPLKRMVGELIGARAGIRRNRGVMDYSSVHATSPEQLRQGAQVGSASGLSRYRCVTISPLSKVCWSGPPSTG